MRFVQKGLDRGDELGGEFFAALGNESRQGVTFERLPKAFDGVEVGTVRRKVDRFDVMPVGKCSKIVPLFRGGADRVEFAHAQKTFRRASARALPRCPLCGGGIPPSGPAPVGRPVQRRTQPAG